MPISVKAATKRDGGKKDGSTYTINELAKLEKVATKTVYMWIIKGKLKDAAKKDADGIWRISKAKFKRPPGLVEQVKLNAAARKKEMSQKKPAKPESVTGSKTIAYKPTKKKPARKPRPTKKAAKK